MSLTPESIKKPSVLNQSIQILFERLPNRITEYLRESKIEFDNLSSPKSILINFVAPMEQKIEDIKVEV